MIKPLDLHGLKTIALKERPSKVFVEDVGRPVSPGSSIADWLGSLPRQLAGNELRRPSQYLRQETGPAELRELERNGRHA